MNDRLYNAIGLCMKAGKASSGAYSVEKAIRSGKARLVFLENTASDSTKDRYISMCSYYNVPIFMTDSVGEAIGKPERIVMAVTDDAFYRMMDGLIAQNSMIGGK